MPAKTRLKRLYTQIVAGVGGYDPPVMPVAPHHFQCVEGFPCCAQCGGGIMHEVHQVEEPRCDS